MPRNDTLRWSVVTIAVLVVAYQMFIPPIVGLADQGDFARIIGRFGYAAEDKSTGTKYAFVVRKYVPDPSARVSVWEQVNPEYVFVGSALLLSKVLSKDLKLDILFVGLLHMLVFFVAFVRLLS